jgi:hypothetical protein
LKKSGAIVGATSLSSWPSLVQSSAPPDNGAMVTSVEELGGGVRTDVATADTTDLPHVVQRIWSADVLAPQCVQFMTDRRDGVSIIES